MVQETGAELLVRALRHEGVQFLFGIPGGQLLPVLEACRKLPPEENLPFVTTRHEQAAAHMADAWFRLTGKLAACIGTVGPGAVNLIPGVFEAFSEGIPLLVITAQNQSWRSYPDHGSSQGCDHLQLFRGITKWNAVVAHRSRILELLQTGIRAALSGRPGPVHLDVPVDVLFSKDERVTLGPRVVVPRTAAPEELIRAAAAMLSRSERPLIHAGGGVLISNASAELLRLAEWLGCPVTTSVFGRGSIPEDHPLCLKVGGYGALAAQVEADVVLAVGTRFGDLDLFGRFPAWGPPESQDLIQIDVDPQAIGRNRPADLGLVGDAALVLQQLYDALRKTGPNRTPTPKLEEYRSLQEEWMAEFLEAPSQGAGIHPAVLVKRVRDLFPRNAVSVVDGGNIQVWCNALNHVYEPRTLLHQADSGMLGGGLPKVIAAQLACKDRPAYLITGDGSFGFNIQELETARRLGVHPVVIVANDRAWGMIKGAQMGAYGAAYGVDFADARYDLIARGFGCFGERVETQDQLTAALCRAIESNLPAVLDVLIDPAVNLRPPGLEMLEGIWLEGVL